MPNYQLKFKVKKNIKLAPYTSFGIGGSADFFIETATQEELIEAVKWAKKEKIKYFVLGGGSNILISDAGFRGLVIKISNIKYQISNCNIQAEAGLLLVTLIKVAYNHSLSGLEFLAGIPGTLGGAIVGNAGAKAGNISQVVEKIRVLDKHGKIYYLYPKQCQFDYRLSRFKHSSEIILEAVLKLKRKKQGTINLGIKKFLALRKNQPKGRSAGCIFKNPTSSTPAGWLVDKVGLKGEKIGGALISSQHANWIINLGNAKATDVLRLIRLAKERVKHRFGIKLNEEIFLMGDF
ncbi:MAG TPA: UDP-N-acetylmuramate dehydrogenase [Candidatus Bathyarchaeia archaeon]|nr:UDP-N-acetylmuramate dehydrogenase [Candidatus Bathyarchaeia archaeon]